MSSLTLRPWPFTPGELVEVYWFASPHIDQNKAWKLNIAFKGEKEPVKLVSYPWGTFPFFRLGQHFRNGKLDLTEPSSGYIQNLTLNNLNQGIIVNSFDMPKGLIHLNQNPNLGLQKVIKYSVGGTHYYIPVMEFIRFFFINSRTLALSLLQPHGLDSLIDNLHIFDDNKIHLRLNRKIPTNLVNDNEIIHLAWIYCDPYIRHSWESVFQKLYKNAISKFPSNPLMHFSRGIPLEIDLPKTDQVNLYFRGLQYYSHVLILEMIGITGLEYPFSEVTYYHPSLKRQVSVKANKKVRFTQNEKSEQYLLNDHSEEAKEDVIQDAIETMPIYLRFENLPNIKGCRLEERKVNKGEEIIVIGGRGGKNLERKISTEESIYGGDTPPIEFSSLEVLSPNEAIGLEAFFQVIQLLKKKYPVEINMSILRLPLGKKFSLCPDGSRRTCAIVQIRTSNHTKYIIEVARPDSWSISTLILSPKEKFPFRRVESDMKNLLEDVVNKGGHWDQSIIDGYYNWDIIKLRHSQGASLHDWGENIVHKLAL